MFYAFCSISVICKIGFYFKSNLAKASVCDNIKPCSIKSYLLYGHPILGPSVFIPGEINGVTVGYKGYTPFCFTSRNSDKTCMEPHRHENMVLITVYISSLAYSLLKRDAKMPL